MIKGALPAAIGFLGLCFPVAAQQANRLEQSGGETITSEELRRTGEVDTGPALTLSRADIFSGVDGSVLIRGLPVLTLLDGRRLPAASELGRMGRARLDFVPLAFLNAVEVQKSGGSPIYGSDSPGGVVNLRLNRDYSGGEVGFFYGKSSGRFSREEMQSYIIGTVGNEKFQITAGAAYEESSWRIPRRGR